MTDNFIVVSADSHAGARPEGYRPYLDELALAHFDEFVEDDERSSKAMSIFLSDKGAFGPDWLPLVDKDEAIRSGGLDGAWDPARRLREMDREGVAAEVLFHGPQNAASPFFTPSSRKATLDLRAAGLRAYHRWLADFVADSDGRLVPTADIAGVDMKATAAELEWCAAHGFKGVQVPGLCTEPALPPLDDAYYEPFWAVCEEAGLRLTIHAGWGMFGHGQFLEMFERLIEAVGDDWRRFSEMPMVAEPAEPAESPFTLDGGFRRAMWQLMAGGVFDRHPELRLVLTEVRAGLGPGHPRASGRALRTRRHAVVQEPE